MRFTALDGRSIWTADEIPAPTLNAAFFVAQGSAGKAAIDARRDLPGGTVQLRLNAVIDYADQPSVLQRSLINGCLIHALKFSPAGTA